MNHLAYASDFKNIESELKQVVDFAAAFQADVHVIHVAQDDITQQYIEVDTLIKQWQTLTKYKRINFHLIQGSEQTPVNESLGKLINQVQADLLLVFHEQRNFWKSLFEKSIAAEIVYEWTRPILIIPKK
jgi:K+-sensing histidine kinase KdpD